MAETVGRIMIVRTSAAAADRGHSMRYERMGSIPDSHAPGGDWTNSGNEHKEPPQTIDHTGNGCQELDNILEHELELGGRKSWVRKIAIATPKNPPVSGQQRTVQRAPNFRQHAELPLVDVPGSGGEKMQLLLYGRSGLPTDPPQEVQHQQNGKPGKGIRQAAK